MSLQSKIFELIKDLKDPSMRVDVAATIGFLSDMYNMGRISEEEFREALMDVCTSVYRETKKGLEDEIIRDLAEKMVEELVAAAKISGLRRRVGARYGLRF